MISRHDSCAIVACTKFCCHMITNNLSTDKWNFHRIWIVIEKQLVKWVPDVINNSKTNIMNYTLIPKEDLVNWIRVERSSYASDYCTWVIHAVYIKSNYILLDWRPLIIFPSLLANKVWIRPFLRYATGKPNSNNENHISFYITVYKITYASTRMAWYA